ASKTVGSGPGRKAAMVKLVQSYVHGASAVPLIGETIGVRFDRAVARWPESEALVVRHQGVRWTYRELQRQVDAFAAGLLALGLEAGDRVGIWSPNNAEWVVTQFATAKAGIILVNINPAYRLTELEHALNKVGCKGLILAATFKSSDYVAMLRQLAPELDSFLAATFKSSDYVAMLRQLAPELDSCRRVELGDLHAARLP